MNDVGRQTLNLYYPCNWFECAHKNRICSFCAAANRKHICCDMYSRAIKLALPNRYHDILHILAGRQARAIKLLLSARIYIHVSITYTGDMRTSKIHPSHGGRFISWCYQYRKNFQIFLFLQLLESTMLWFTGLSFFRRKILNFHSSLRFFVMYRRTQCLL